MYIHAHVTIDTPLASTTCVYANKQSAPAVAVYIFLCKTGLTIVIQNVNSETDMHAHYKLMHQRHQTPRLNTKSVIDDERWLVKLQRHDTDYYKNSNKMSGI